MKRNICYFVHIIIFLIGSLISFLIFLNFSLSHVTEETKLSAEHDLYYAWHRGRDKERTPELVDSIYRSYLELNNSVARYKYDLISFADDGSETLLATIDRTAGKSIKRPYCFSVNLSNSSKIVANVEFDLVSARIGHLRLFTVPLIIFIISIILSLFLIVCVFKENKAIGQSKREFVNVVAHNMRNPLGVAHAATEALLDNESIKSDDTCTRLLNVSLRQMNELDSQLESVLRTMKLWKKKDDSKTEEINLKSMVEEIVKDFKIADPQAEFVVDVDSSHTFRAVPEHVSSALSVILDNSLKYNKDIPHITIFSRQDSKGNVSLSIKDDGIGFSKNELKNAFKEYSRGKRGSKLAPGGYGTGLHYVKQLSNANKCCDVRIDSEENVGSTVTLIQYVGRHKRPIHVGKKAPSQCCQCDKC